MQDGPRALLPQVFRSMLWAESAPHLRRAWRAAAEGPRAARVRAMFLASGLDPCRVGACATAAGRGW
eukprot:1283181-Pyramimonas_sp.AAC.1